MKQLNEVFPNLSEEAKDKWGDRYVKFVPKFIEYAKQKNGLQIGNLMTVRNF